MTKRTDDKGFPFANDPIKVDAIAGVIAAHVICEVDPSGGTKLSSKVESDPEYSGLTNSEYWLAVMDATNRINAYALTEFTKLITDKDDDDDWGGIEAHLEAMRASETAKS
jgi:hypothetical protein